jgi:hypothetical protein
VALLVSAVLLTTTISSLIGGSAKVIGSVAGGATATAVNNAGGIIDVIEVIDGIFYPLAVQGERLHSGR